MIIKREKNSSNKFIFKNFGLIIRKKKKTNLVNEIDEANFARLNEKNIVHLVTVFIYYKSQR